jgi:putative hydrolase of the HAD superfamily
MIRAVLFDLEETLIDRRSSLIEFLKAQREGNEHLHEVERPTYIESFLALDDYGRIGHMVAYQKLVKDLGLGCAAEGLIADYEERLPAFARLFPHVLTALKGLKDRGLKLGVVTNGPAPMHARMVERLSLAPLMDATVFGDGNLRKPDPAIFRHAATRLNVAPEECAFVGDSPIVDIVGAHRAGMKPVWIINAVFNPPSPDTGFTPFRDFRELEGIVTNPGEGAGRSAAG